MKPRFPAPDQTRRFFLGLLVMMGLSSCAPREPAVIVCPADPDVLAPPDGLKLTWEKEVLTVESPKLPGGKLEVWYLEAVCRSGSTRREWAQTLLPHKTRLAEASSDGKRLRLLTEVEGGLELVHEITAGADEVDFKVTATNHGAVAVDAQWAQPCLVVGPFTGREKGDYIARSFIFIDGQLTPLDQTRREEEAIYRGGQVYVPEGISHEDVNPRPISPDVPSSSLIGCFSADGSRILATAWEPCQELFQGVRVCLHADFRLGGLDPGAVKRVRGKIYVVPNDPEALVARYSRDFREE